MIDTLEKMPVAFTPERLARVEELISHYPETKQKSAILPILHLAQEQWGWLRPEVMDYVGEILDIQSVEVYEVATFYSMFHLEPVGKHVIEICRTGPCGLLGYDGIRDHLCQNLQIELGGTSADGLFTLKEVECLAACGMGPVFQIREKYHLNLTPERVDAILEDYRRQG
ncbi:MAG: NAD(P)H-dependent oxidoreductase subunit E [Cytophagaceae bacterium]|nr:NAD(P)H-dependent oxidoreductase subunit E [Cytophagaceae bacterium]